MATILIVDDTLSELQLIGHYLQQGGHTVISATDAKEALHKAIERQPDAIVADLMMPGMSGLELCRKLKKTPETAKIPFVACTVKDQDVDRLWAKKQGVDAYLVKPCTCDQLLDALKTVAQ